MSGQKLHSLNFALTAMMEAVAAHRQNQPTETLPLAQLRRKVLAQAINAPQDSPPFARCMMDGYALAHSDWRSAEEGLPISQRVAAGELPQPLIERTTARVFTGAPLPQGATCVVAQEQCYEENGKVWIGERPRAGQMINPRGDDWRAHAALLPQGTLITPAHIGLLASVGLHSALVYSPPSVAVLCTGLELVEPGTLPTHELPNGKIFNSNGPMLATLLHNWGVQARVLTITDDRQETQHTLAQLAETQSLIVSIGGASVGEADHVRAVLQESGALSLWQLAIKPGKPFMFGTWPNSRQEPCWIAGLPGNPVAAFVTAGLMVRPLVRALQGQISWRGDVSSVLPPSYTVKAQFDWPKPDPIRREFLRVQCTQAHDGVAQATLLPNQKSSALLSLALSDGLIDNPPGRVIRYGDECRYIPMSALVH